MTFASDSLAFWTTAHAERDATKIALVDLYDRVSFEELDRRSARVAGALRDAGVGHGDRVAVVLKNRIEFLEVLFASARLGARFAPMNYRMSSKELAFVLRDSDPRVVITQEQFASTVKTAMTAADVEVPFLLVDGTPAFAEWREASEPQQQMPVRLDDDVMILYTSGTTGYPKGVRHTNESILFNTVNALTDWGLHREDRTLVVNPIFHSVLNAVCTPLLYLGGTCVLREDFKPAEALSIIDEERITVMLAIPTAWQMMTELPEFESADLSTLRFVASSGAAAPLPLMRKFTDRGVMYVQAFGLTETNFAMTMRAEDQERKLGSIGRPSFHTLAKVVASDGRPAARGERGELLLRGRNVTPGYWQSQDETDASFTEDGWFKTGDIVTQDDDGFFFIVDRSKDIIISGGENIASSEVEQVLYTHPAIRECAVIGVPHEKWGETPMAVVSVLPNSSVSAEELIDYCRERLAHYKAPTSVRFVEELPKTATGKIRKESLRTSG